MIVVIPFCEKDWHLAALNLDFCLIKDKHAPPGADHCLLSWDTETSQEGVNRMHSLASRYFTKVDDFTYGAPPKKGWPIAANVAWQSVAWDFFKKYPDQPWLWWESDAAPLRENWLRDLHDAHVAGGKPFSGHVVAGMGHMNGVGIYPANMHIFCPETFMAQNAAWDVTMGPTGKSVMRHVNPINHLIQHCWNVDNEGNPTNGEGAPAWFKSWEQLTQSPHRVDFRCALYHRDKYGAIVQLILKQDGAMADGTPTEVNVPVHAPCGVTEEAVPKATEKYTGKCQILIVTHEKDYPWLYYCLQLIDKYCKGFAGVTLAVPTGQTKPLREWKKKHRPQIPILFYAYDEVPGKGMVQHMERIFHADEIIPKGTDHVLHMDADCMFHSPVTPEEYIHGERPVYVWRSYDSLINTQGERKVVSDCYQWKEHVEKALGLKVNAYTMCRHPTVLPWWFYEKARSHITKATGIRCKEYIMSCRNEFPQTFCEWGTLGAYAYEAWQSRFVWIDCAGGPAPKDKMKPFWSHGGLDGREDGASDKPTPREEIEGFLKA